MSAQKYQKSVRKAHKKYLRIKWMFHCGDPNAESAWKNFVNNGGWSLAYTAVTGKC